MSKRNCGYCGASRGMDRCKCRYRAGRMGKASITMENHSEQTTLGEFLDAVQEYFGKGDRNAKGFWMCSFTTQDEAKVAKMKAKATEGKKA